jgi:flagellar secretion chaperone FliS
MDAGSAYREGAVRGASRVRLVIFLYEQAIQDLRRAALAMEQGHIELRTRHINHAVSVIGHLQGTLDRERGGEVVRDLERYYTQVRGRLIDAQATVSPTILLEQIRDLLSVREAWIEVERATGETYPASTGSGGDQETLTASGL